ncbi:hypothetical protein acdb102_31030 [Acidothermaceae bacterium B102]|nr:hypothetical protein acdb102_31030 [Acidothermaceae bacterium B102]
MVRLRTAFDQATVVEVEDFRDYAGDIGFVLFDQYDPSLRVEAWLTRDEAIAIAGDLLNAARLDRGETSDDFVDA